jgi:hypothetical protein
MTRVFISYSHKDSRWLNRLLVHLRPLERNARIDLWADTRIKPGEDWIEQIESALAEAQVAVLLVSADFLASEFIASKELPALLQKAKRRECKVLSVVVGPCLFSSVRDLQQFQAINSPERSLAKMRKAEAEQSLVKLADIILEHKIPDSGVGLKRGSHESDMVDDATHSPSGRFIGDPRIDGLLGGIKLADWDLAAGAALKVIAETDSRGCNQTFESLLNYQDCSDDDDRFWGALHTVESCVRLAPWLIDHAKLSRMAAHGNFSVRSCAASICMDLAHSAPDRVPLDIVLKLSVYDEDWYVEAPANAALKAMARSFPEVLRIFYGRLRSVVGEERAHAAWAIEDVAESEPALLDPRLLAVELAHLERLGDTKSVTRMRNVLSKIKGVARTGYRYGL